MASVRFVESLLDLEQARDLRRSVFCGELNWSRDAVDDGADSGADIALGWEGGKPAATGRLVARGERAWLELWAVLPSLRRKGLGTAVLALLEARARTSAWPELWALAPFTCAPAFQRLGFETRQEESGVLVLAKELR